MDILYVYLGVYILALLIIAYFVSRGESDEGFLIANRDRGSWAIMSSKFAGSIGANWFVSYTAYAYEYGLGMYGILAGFVIGYTLFALWAGPRIYKNSREDKFYTQGDFVFNSLKSRPIRNFIDILAIIIMSFWALIGVVGGAKIMSYFGLLSYEWAVLFTSVIVLVYILMAGFKAVIMTDILQSAIIVLLLGFLSFSLVKDVGIVDILSVETGTLTLASFVGFFLYGITTVFSSPDRYQLCYASKDVKTLKRGLGFAIVPAFIAASFLMLIGLFIFTQNTNLDSGLVFIEALKNYLPKSLLPLGIVLFFAGLMSSVDTYIYGITSHYSLLFKENKEKLVSNIKLAVLFLTITLSVMAYFFRDVVDITVFAAGFSLTTSVAMIYLILGYNNSKRFLGSIVVSILSMIIGIAIFGLEPAVALPVLIGGVLGLAYNPKAKKQLSV